MRIDAKLEALRGDPASQRRTREAMKQGFREWSSLEAVAEISTAMKVYAQCGVLERCAPLAGLLSDAETAREFIDEWAGHFSRALATEELGLIPFRHSYSPGLSTLQLIAMG
ncbi:hypothetical protein SAMN06297468_0394 [Altererythrobacter xiamenensis]|uniref:Uncharacterized protein n=1 Tax=Altererythrobacter xiamenensis TaxID=1316679 RepID=A0A1Y6EGG2_9SPHN|nr:hypothetical protein SAMN06297468_0394 [Altererythrobacter xiamenensis]